MSKPTPEQIKKEILALRDVRDKVPPWTLFGDDNVAAVDATMYTLIHNLSEEEIWQKYEDGQDTNPVVDSAIEARQWLDGDDPEAPSVGWRRLAGLEPEVDKD